MKVNIQADLKNFGFESITKPSIKKQFKTKGSAIEFLLQQRHPSIWIVWLKKDWCNGEEYLSKNQNLVRKIQKDNQWQT